MGTVPTPFELTDIHEIAAGPVQLQPIDEYARSRAARIFGAQECERNAVWVSREATTAQAKAYVMLAFANGEPVLTSAAGEYGAEQDAAFAQAVVERYVTARLA